MTAEYEAAVDRYGAARAELDQARHALELAQREEYEAGEALVRLEAAPGIPADPAAAYDQARRAHIGAGHVGRFRDCPAPACVAAVGAPGGAQ